MTFLSAFTSIVVLLLLAVYNVESNLNLNFDGSTNSALFLDVGHLNHSKEFLLNAQSNVRFFAVFEPYKPVSLKSVFGPISVRETIYPNTIQDALLANSKTTTDSQHRTHRTSSPIEQPNNTEETATILLPANTAELTTHLVSNTVYRNSPQLRILFQLNSVSTSQTSSVVDLDNVDQTDHTEHLDHQDKINSNNSSNNNTEQHHLCAIAIFKFNSIESDTKEEQFKPLVASCELNSEGICIVQTTIPANWWPSITLDAVSNNNGEQSKLNSKQNTKPGNVEVLYTSAYSDKCGENSNKVKSNKEHTDAMANLDWRNSNLHIENAGKIQLKPFDGIYEELTNDDIIRILIPQKPVHAKTRIHIPVCYRYHRNYPLFAFALRVRVKPGMRVLGATIASRTQLNPQPLTLTNSGRSSKRKQNRLLNEYNRLNTAQNWEIFVESNNKQTQATITAFLKLNSKDQLVNEEKQIKSEDADENEDDDLDDDMEEFDEDLMNLMPSTCNEVYTILLEVDEKAAEYSDAGRISWQLLYLTDLENSKQIEDSNGKKHHFKRDFDSESSKLTCKLDIQKDEIESVLALTPNRNLLNMAILTGKQIMQSLKIYVVTNSGSFRDVTLQASCSSSDETVLKISPSCTALYLDGSETRSSINATIQIHYGVHTGTSSFQVWMPKLPLELDVSDDKLSVINSWKIPHLKQSNNHSKKNGYYGHERIRKQLSPHSHHSLHSNKHHNHHKHKSKSSDAHETSEIGCRSRYQQAYIEAYAKFYISDENSGREWSFINRKYSFRITDLILPHLYLSDNRLAIIRSNTIEGLNPGNVELKVLSPITGKQLASKKILITSDQETITNLQVRLLTGLQMQIKPEHTILDQTSSFGHSMNHMIGNSLGNSQVTVWSVRTNGNSALTTQYQEGLLDIEIKFSDDKVVSLNDITDSDYHLNVDAGTSGMIAYASGLSASLPRIIALKNGNNIKLGVSLQVPVQCAKKNTLPLQEQLVYLNVNLNQKAKSSSTYSNIQPHNETKSTNDKQSQQISVEHLENTNLQNDGHDESNQMLPTAQVQRFHSLYNSQLSVAQRNKLVRPIETNKLTSWNGVEIGVYTILCVLGLLMAAFTTGCFIVAMKQKNNHSPPEFATVTTVKHNDQDPSNNGSFLNNNLVRNKMNKIMNDWTWMQQANEFNKDEENQICYDVNGNPIIQSRVNVRSNPFDEDEIDREENVTSDKNIFENKNRQSIISYPGSEISIQITTNPIVNAIENVTKNALENVTKTVLKRVDKNKNIQEEVSTPEPDLQEIKNMLNYCKSVEQPSSNAKLVNKNKSKNGHLNRQKQPPPIPPRRQQMNNNSATFVRGKRTAGQQLPVHIPGIACRTLNAINLSNKPDTSNDTINNPINNSSNSINNSPINSSNKSSPPNLSPSLSLSSDSGIERSESPIEEQKHLITNPFLNGEELNERFNKVYDQTDLNEQTTDRIELIEKETINNEQVYVNTNGPAVPKHNATNLSSINRQRTRIIPPKSLFEEMNYNEIVNYIDHMPESTA